MKHKIVFAILILLAVLFLAGLRHQFYEWPAEHIKTYPGDIWYVYSHYIQASYPFPVEYPSLMRVFVQLVNTVTIRSYPGYLWSTIYFLLPFAIGTTLILSRELQNQKSPHSRLYQYWIFAPSFIVCALTNYDLVSVFTLVLGLYLARSGKRAAGAVSLAIGTAFKVFPGYFFPLILILCRERHELLRVLAAFFGTWLAINIPYMLGDANGIRGWLEPYLWQSQCNFAKGPGDGSLWWPLYRILGNGSISVFFTFCAVAAITLKALRAEHFEENIWEWGRGIALAFLLCDRIYSPQYHLYLLPFLALSREKVDNRAFYALELPNSVVLIFLFFLREHGLYMGPLMILKYIALIVLMVQFYRDVIKEKSVPPNPQSLIPSP